MEFNWNEHALQRNHHLAPDQWNLIGTSMLFNETIIWRQI
jgi:hypothetical protein